MSTFTRDVEITPAFDKRHSDPSKNYGIHGVEIKFVLRGEKGVIQFAIYTNWHLPHVQAELDGRYVDHTFCHPTAYDIGYHSERPIYEGQDVITESCPYLDGKPCYYDGSSLNAKPILEKLISGGDKVMWAELEEWYGSVFERHEVEQ